MRILVYGINYSPEEIGIGKYTTEMCEWLVTKGHSVNVITAMPYYPNWSVNRSYKHKWWFKEIINGVIVFRCPIYVPRNVNGVTRILHELSFALSSIGFFITFLFKRVDVVISIAPPIQVGLFPIVISKIKRIRTIHHIQDLQLDAARELGLIQNKLILRVASWIEKFILNNSTLVTTISEGMKKRIINKEIKLNDIYLLRNWCDINSIFPTASTASLRSIFGIAENHKIVLYSGNIGEKQGLEMIVEVAATLQDKSIFFLILGAGSFKSKLEEMIIERKLQNIGIFPLQPNERFNLILNMAHIHLVLQKRAATDLVMPSKLSTILAAGGVAIVTAERETSLYNMIKNYQIGFVIEPEDVDLLRNQIIEVMELDLSAIKQRARQFALEYLSKEKILEDFHQKHVLNVQMN